LKIAVDISVMEKPPSGIARVVSGLYNACLNLDPTLQVVGVHRRALTCELPPRFCDNKYQSWIPDYFWRLGALPLYLRSNSPDIIHYPWNGGVVRSEVHCRTVVTVHDVIPIILPEMHFKTNRQCKAYRRNLQNSLDLADVVLTDSEASKSDILEYFQPQSEPVVVYPATSLDGSGTDHQPSLVQSSGHYYLYQGGYHPRKGLQDLIPVFIDLFAQRIISHPLVLVGKANYRQAPNLRAEITRGIKEGAVIERGYVDDAVLVDLMRNAIALIYPSLYEGFGLPPLEAMAVGCPVISTNTSSIPEVCGNAALLCNPGNRESLGEAIVLMEKNPELRGKLRLKGLERAKKFTWEASAKTYLDTLNTG